MKKGLVLLGSFNDLSDVLRIARANGKKLFNTQKVRVLPELHKIEGGVLVVVENEV